MGAGGIVHPRLNMGLKDISLWSLLIVMTMGILGAILIAYSTSWGPWVFSDSTVYITVARNFIEGRGFGLVNPSGVFRPLYHFPPLYPLILSSLSALGLNILDAARVLNITLFASFVVILGSAFYYTTKSMWVTIIYTCTIALLPELLKIFSGAMSEPLSICLGFSGLILLGVYIEKQSRFLLYCSALLVGLATITRYIAVAYLLAGLSVLLLLDRNGWRRKLVDIFQYFLIGIIPLVAWFIWLNGQKNTARIFHMSSHIWSDLGPLRKDVIGITWSWLPFSDKLAPISYNSQKYILLFILLLIASLIILIKRRQKNWGRENHIVILAATFGVFILAYLLSLAFAYIFTVPQPDIDQRILLPVHLAGMVLILGLLSYIVNLGSQLKTLRYLQLLPLIYLITFLPGSFGILQDYHQAGYGYTSKYWRESPTVKAVLEMPPNIALISNEAAVLQFYTERPVYEIPELIYSEHPMEFSHYGDDSNDQAQKLFRENKAALVLFDDIYYQFERLDTTNAQERLDTFIQGMNVYADYGDGTIYFYTTYTP